MAIATQRYVAPIFAHDTDGQTLQHSGTHNGVEFAITFEPYSHTAAGNFEQIIKFAASGVRALLIDNGMFFNERTGTLASHALVVDIKESRGDENIVFSRFDAALPIQESALSAIRLTSSAGVWSERVFEFRDPPLPAGGMMFSKPYSSMFQYAGDSSVLAPSEFARCVTVMDALRARFTAIGGSALHNIFWLAWNYHRLAMTFEQPAHGYLVLMIAFEAMFSRSNEDVSKAAQRIGRFLGQTQKQCAAIGRTFDETFRPLRNEIAHGDPSLTAASVLKEFPSLHQHVGKAIAELVLLPPIDPTKDYYDEIEQLAKTRYFALPRK